MAAVETIRRSSALLVVAVLGLARVVAAQPQPSPQLTTEFQAGVDEFRLGHFDEARTHLEAARVLDPKLPGPHRFLAAVAQAQGRWQDCLDSARAALIANPLSSEAPETRKLHEACRTSAGRAPYRGELGDSAAIAVTANAPGATVKIGGITYGGTPLAPRPITAGTLELEVAKIGWKPAHLSLDAPAGIVTDVAVTLEPDPNVAAESGTVPAMPTTTSRTAVTPAPPRVDTAASQHAERVGFTYLAIAGAVLAGGFSAKLVAEHYSAQAHDIARIEDSRDPANPQYGLEPLHTAADLAHASSRASNWDITAELTCAAGLALVGVGAYYLYRGARDQTDAPPAIAIAPLAGGALIAKTGTW